MALDENVSGLLSLPAGSDLSAKQYYAVKINASGQLALCSTGEQAVGILYTKPSAQGNIGGVHPLDGRKVKAIAGGSITAGDLLKSDSAGKLVTASKATVDTLSTGIASDPVVGSNVLGIAEIDAVDGDIFTFVALALGAVPTTAA